MSLNELKITENGVTNRDKVQIAIARLRTFVPADGTPYWLAFSGGKDSQVIYHLAQEAGVPFEAHYNITTLDPPELVQFIRHQYPDVIRDQPKMSMWRLIEKNKILPLQQMRYCCAELKEKSGINRTVVTGVRWAESTNRKQKRNGVELNVYSSNEQKFFFDNIDGEQMYRICKMQGKHVINPIIDWIVEDVWDFIRSRNLPYCCLYDEGFTRLGCIGCPCASERQRRKEFERWPTYKTAYLHAIKRSGMGRKRGETAEDVLEWWLSGKGEMKQLEEQINFEDL